MLSPDNSMTLSYMRSPCVYVCGVFFKIIHTVFTHLNDHNGNTLNLSYSNDIDDIDARFKRNSGRRGSESARGSRLAQEQEFHFCTSTGIYK